MLIVPKCDIIISKKTGGIYIEINFSKLTTSNQPLLLEPRDIFMALPSKDSRYGYPRDVQSEVWKQWFESRNEKNSIIKMNTGSGKTTVGLTILQSCLNEGKWPAVYVVPDNYLVQQVYQEAEKLGIRVVRDEFDENGKKVKDGTDDYQFKNGKAIFVTNIHKLVNGRSIFGMRKIGNVQIKSIILDDVHACMDTIKQQHTISIKSNHPLYNQIIEIFSTFPEITDSQSFYDVVKRRDKLCNYLVPFWCWQNKSKEIYEMITRDEFSENRFVTFNFPLLKDNWKTCNCVISTSKVELTLKGTPINKIKSFEQAERRIFMSATLPDDSVFVSAIGLESSEVSNIITPEKASDMGERIILFPKYLNAKVTDEEIKQILVDKSKECNVVVIIPSFPRVEFWRDAQPKQILSSRDENIEAGIELLKSNSKVGLTIIVNRYDGIDLPDEACRILVLDGLPAMQNEYDSAIRGMNPDSKRIYREQIQKIEQGMGRGVRSNVDYCVVILMGNKLENAIANQGGVEFFSNATREQYNLSKQLWDQLIELNPAPSVNDIFTLANYTLHRNHEWIEKSKSILATIEYSKTENVDSVTVALRKAFERECLERYDEAYSILEGEKNKLSVEDKKTRGLILQYMAEYKNFTNPSQAQELLLSARNLNPMLLKPLGGIQFEKLQCTPNGQAIQIIKYFNNKNFTANNYRIHVNSILSDLVFAEGTSDLFEKALMDIATVIGISSSRPEKERNDTTLDNLFAFDNGEYMLIECKNGTTTDKISKDDCEQLLGAIEWFKNNYTGKTTFYPVIIHNSNKFSSVASPNKNTRIMTPTLLEKFCSSIQRFSEAFIQNDVVGNALEVEKLLSQLKLNGNQIVSEYTIEFIQK